MTILVIGASGFVGSNLLQRNVNFLGCDLHTSTPRIKKLDARKTELLKSFIDENGVNTLIVAAGTQYLEKIPPSKRTKYFQTGNVELCQSIANCAQSTAIRKIVFLSTDMVYGSVSSSPIDETYTTNPWGPYGKSKIESEQILIKNATCEVTIFRPRLILGIGRAGTIAKLATIVKRKLPIPIIGDGLNRYQFVGIEDVCHAIELSLVITSPGVYNLGSNNPPQIKNLLPEVLESLGYPGRVIKIPASSAKRALRFLDRLGFSPLAPEQFEIADNDYVLNTSKAIQVLGWIPKENDKELLVKSLSYLIKK
jgi:dTDP-glucose 4,6-dehydratase